MYVCVCVCMWSPRGHWTNETSSEKNAAAKQRALCGWEIENLLYIYVRGVLLRDVRICMSESVCGFCMDKENIRRNMYVCNMVKRSSVRMCLVHNLVGKLIFNRFRQSFAILLHI